MVMVTSELVAAAHAAADAMPVAAPMPADRDCSQCRGRGLTPTANDEAQCRRCLGSGAKTRAVRDAWIAANAELQLARLRVLYRSLRDAMKAAEALAPTDRAAQRDVKSLRRDLDILERHAQGIKDSVVRLTKR